MSPFVIPTIFQAFDKFSVPVQNMSASLNGLNIHAARAERVFSSMTKPFQGIVGNMIEFASAAAVAGAIIGTIIFTAKGVADYATEISNLSAVTGATGRDLDVFKDKIAQVATETKKSMVFVAQAFTAVDNNMPELHKNADALAEVTKQAIILAKASRIELAPAAEYLTMSMNQFGHTAAQASRDVDAMAAGAVYGSSRIGETAEALQKFGTVAANVAHITFAESVALVELGSKFEKGSEAGTRFRNILLAMTNIKPGSEISQQMAMYGVNIRKVANTSLPLLDRLQEISKIKNSPMLMEGLFDKRNVAMAAGLFSRIDKFKGILGGLSVDGLAAQMAATNTDNMTGALEQLRDKWMNLFITGQQVNFGMNLLKNTVQFLTNHLGGLVTIGITALELFAAFKGYIIATRTAMVAYNFVMGVATVMNGRYAVSAFASIAGMNGMAFASFFLEASLLQLYAATGGILAIIGLAIYAFGDFSDQSSQVSSDVDKVSKSFAKAEKPISDAAIALQEYNRAMKAYNEQENARAIYNFRQAHGLNSFFRDIPLMWQMGTGDKQIPTFNKFGITDSAGVNAQQYMPAPNFDSLARNPRVDSAENAGGNSKQEISLMIHNDSGHELSIDSMGAPDVKVSSTTNSWGGAGAS